MENASKALIIAAAILIAIILIGVGVFVVNQGVGSAKKNASMDAQDVLAFNSKFESYLGEHVRGSTVKSLISAVANNNRVAEDDSLKVNITGVTDVKAGSIYTVTPTYDQGGLMTTINIALSTAAAGNSTD